MASPKSMRNTRSPKCGLFQAPKFAVAAEWTDGLWKEEDTQNKSGYETFFRMLRSGNHVPSPCGELAENL